MLCMSKPGAIFFSEDYLHIALFTNLVNGTWDETANILLVTEDEGKGCREGWCSLNSWEHNLPNVGAVIKAEDPLHLVKCHMLHYINHVLIEVASNMPARIMMQNIVKCSF